MEKSEIRPLLSRNVAKNSLSLQRVLEEQIKGLFAAFGKHHTMEPERINADCLFMSKRLNDAIKGEKRYQTLRMEEIPYLFKQGMQGAFQDKYKNISLMMVFGWFSEYVNHPERRAALYEWVVMNSNDLPEDVPGRSPQLSEEEMWEWVEKSYNSYCEQIMLQTKKIIPAFLQKDKVPWAGRDVSGLQTKFLVRLGYMTAEEKFVDFLERAIGNEGVFVKIA